MLALQTSQTLPEDEVRVIAELRALKLDDTTPMDALLALQRWTQQLGDDES